MSFGLCVLLAGLWTAGAIVWAASGNPWLSALFAMNAGIWVANSIKEW